MTNKPRRAGTAYETDMARYFQELGAPFDAVDRQPLRGIRDTGDLDGFPEPVVPGLGRYAWVVGCKAEQTLQLGKYMDEMNAQAANVMGRRGGRLAGVWPVELVARRVTGPGDGQDRTTRAQGRGPRSYAVMEATTLADVIRVMHLAASLRKGGTQ